MQKERKPVPLSKTYKRNPKSIRNFRIKQDVPVKLSKSHLRRAIAQIRKEDDEKPFEHKMVKEYGPKAEYPLRECLIPSTDFFSTHVSKGVSGYFIIHLLYQLRRSLLNHDWSHACHLLRLLIDSKQVNKRLMIHIIRTTLIILLHQDPEFDLLGEFLAISLGLNDDTKIADYIQSIFVLPERLKLGVRLESLRNNGPISAGRVSSSKRKSIKTEDDIDD